MQNVNTMKLSRITIGVRTVVSYFDYTERWSDPSWTMIILYMAQLEHHNKSTGSYTQSGFAALLGAFMGFSFVSPREHALLVLLYRIIDEKWAQSLEHQLLILCQTVQVNVDIGNYVVLGLLCVHCLS